MLQPYFLSNGVPGNITDHKGAHPSDYNIFPKFRFCKYPYFVPNTWHCLQLIAIAWHQLPLLASWLSFYILLPFTMCSWNHEMTCKTTHRSRFPPLLSLYMYAAGSKPCMPELVKQLPIPLAAPQNQRDALQTTWRICKQHTHFQKELKYLRCFTSP